MFKYRSNFIIRPLVILLAVFCALLQSSAFLVNSALATTSINQLSQTEGDVVGGDIITLNGNDFLGETTAKIKKVLTTRGESSFMLTEDGKLYAWGKNDSGQLMLNDKTNRSTPTLVAAISEKIINFSSDGSGTIAVTESGKVYAAGSGYRGRLANGQQYGDLPTVTDISSYFGGHHIISLFSDGDVFFAITTDDKVLTWGGTNSSGENGLGDTSAHWTPAEITALAGQQTRFIILSRHSVFAQTADGRAYAWGNNQFGQLGTGDKLNKTSPVLLDNTALFGGEALTDLATGAVNNGCNGTSVPCNDKSFATTASGKIYIWGHHTDGEFGISGGELLAPTEIDLSYFDNKSIFAVTVDAGSYFVQTTDGKLYAWGNNSKGQTGQSGTTTSSPALIQIGDGSYTVKDFSSRGYTVLALTEDAFSNTHVFSWGNNKNGQTGSGQSGSTPVDITPTVTGSLIASVKFGDQNADFSVDSNNQLTITVPAHAAGNVPVTITTIDGVELTVAGGYTYLSNAPQLTPVITDFSPKFGTIAGGTVVSITGQHFLDNAGISQITSILLDGTPVTFIINSDQSMSLSMPPHAAGSVELKALTAQGAELAIGNFEYIDNTSPLTGVKSQKQPFAILSIISGFILLLVVCARQVKRRKN